MLGYAASWSIFSRTTRLSCFVNNVSATGSGGAFKNVWLDFGPCWGLHLSFYSDLRRVFQLGVIAAQLVGCDVSIQAS